MSPKETLTIVKHHGADAVRKAEAMPVQEAETILAARLVFGGRRR